MSTVQVVVLSVSMMVVAAALLVQSWDFKRQAEAARQTARALERSLNPPEPARRLMQPSPGYYGPQVMLTDPEVRYVLESILRTPAPSVAVFEDPDAEVEAERWTAQVVDAHRQEKMRMFTYAGVDPVPTPGLHQTPYHEVKAATREEAEARAWQWVAHPSSPDPTAP